ncbi:FeoC-like transcriptional regulator [Vibrio quintilis]|uniref:FeoC like transcriptional regulator n=1 Tax=Vibrio quintilis TaxID=1117707 RepID=A0A1M7YTM3_9VIBR|nr:FeoC-like transcriptional regulator [Vibrio quintilis]SHO55906.1 FeoC like transcriptional regulator [Vibrio quintilis]
MILHELKSYLEKHGTVTQKELARHFHLSEDGIDAMLSVWMKKGVVSRLVDTRKTLSSGSEVTSQIRYRMNPEQALSLTVIM